MVDVVWGDFTIHCLTPPGLHSLIRIGRGTTAFAVADADGNMIAVTQTLSTRGGTFYVSNGLGFLYNNHLRFNAGSAPGRFLPLARSSSTSAPTLLFKSTTAGIGSRRSGARGKCATGMRRRRSSMRRAVKCRAAPSRGGRTGQRGLVRWSSKGPGSEAHPLGQISILFQREPVSPLAHP
jgi:hypothetical protein